MPPEVTGSMLEVFGDLLTFLHLIVIAQFSAFPNTF
jgi:hypothetical protein